MNVVERSELASMIVVVQAELGLRFSDTQQLCERVKLRVLSVASAMYQGDVVAALAAWAVAGVEIIVIQQKTGRPVAVTVSRSLAWLIFGAMLEVPVGVWVNYRWYYRYLIRENAHYYPGIFGKAIVTHRGRHEVADKVFRDTRDLVAVAVALGVSRDTAAYYLRDFKE